jgi:hypothetical protein
MTLTDDGMGVTLIGPDDIAPFGREPVGDCLVDHPFVIDDEDPAGRTRHARWRLRADLPACAQVLPLPTTEHAA